MKAMFRDCVTVEVAHQHLRVSGFTDGNAHSTRAADGPEIRGRRQIGWRQLDVLVSGAGRWDAVNGDAALAADDDDRVIVEEVDAVRVAKPVRGEFADVG